MGSEASVCGGIEEGWRGGLSIWRDTAYSLTVFACARAVLEVEGIFAGASSGAVLHCAQRMAERMERGNIVVIFADGGWKYLTSGPWREAAPTRVEHPDDMAWW